jgi:hypothetical protein
LENNGAYIEKQLFLLAVQVVGFNHKSFFLTYLDGMMTKYKYWNDME